jgi:hypothetical protein
MQMQMQLLGPALPTTLSSQAPLGAKEDFRTLELSSIGKANTAKKSMRLVNREAWLFPRME